MRFLSLNQVWAIEPAAARSYLEIYASILARKDAGIALTAEELAARGITGLGGVGDSRAVAVQDGVATISVRGPIVPHADLFDQMSGVASVEGIKAQIAAILADDSIKSWICSLDSPGGVVTGIGALAETIRQACAIKPGVAFVEGMACSAANWLAAGFSQRVVDKSAWMGSIGCITSWTDDRGMKDMVGLKDIEFVSSQSPLKNPDPLTDAGKAAYQQLVDDSAAVFIQDMARLYGVGVDTVKKEFGRGGMFTGAKAVKAGLADKVGSLEQVQQDLARGKYPTRAADAGKGGKTKAASTATTGGTVMTLAELLRSPLSALTSAGAEDDQELLAAQAAEAARQAQATMAATHAAETARIAAQAAAQQAVAAPAQAANTVVINGVEMTAEQVAARFAAVEGAERAALQASATEFVAAHLGKFSPAANHVENADGTAAAAGTPGPVEAALTALYAQCAASGGLEHLTALMGAIPATTLTTTVAKAEMQGATAVPGTGAADEKPLAKAAEQESKRRYPKPKLAGIGAQ